MTARVFACLLTAASGGLTSADLVGLLQVSPASVSKSIGYLELMELVVRKSDPGRRRERYVIVDDVWLRAWRADTGAHTAVASAARRGAEIFGTDTPAGTRLARMGEFFGWLSEQMGAGDPAEETVHDGLTVVAALVYAARPLTVDGLADALGWPRERVTAALGAVERRPNLADPLALEPVAPGRYALAPRPDRLSPAQRASLQPEGR
jgi:hypothetical protein